MKNLVNGLVIYEGLSLLDNKTDIIVVASWDQDNPKTGDMIQTRILVSDFHPVEALKNGGDKSICGNCPRRPSVSNSHNLKECYVEVNGSPSRDWDAYHNLKLFSDNIPNIPIRLGSYGDPVAVPVSIWEWLINKHDQKWTGYTHQWKTKHGQKYKHLCMASCDSMSETKEAIGMGWRTYSALPKGKIFEGTALAQCPASEEAINKKTCVECMACNGSTGITDKRASIKIVAHD